MDNQAPSIVKSSTDKSQDNEVYKILYTVTYIFHKYYKYKYIYYIYIYILYKKS